MFICDNSILAQSYLFYTFVVLLSLEWDLVSNILFWIADDVEGLEDLGKLKLTFIINIHKIQLKTLRN